MVVLEHTRVSSPVLPSLFVKSLIFILQRGSEHPIVFKGCYELFFMFDDKLEVLGRGKPAVHQYIRISELIGKAGLNHGAHQFVFGNVTFTFFLLGINLAIPYRFTDNLESYGNGNIIGIIQCIENIQPYNTPRKSNNFL